MNGGEGFIGRNYLVLHPVETLVECNKALDADKYVPEFLVVGSDGGGEAIAFDRRQEPWAVVMVPFIPLDKNEARPIAPAFGSFFEMYSCFEL